MALFKKFTFDDSVSQMVQAKTSVSRKIAKSLLTEYKGDEKDDFATELDTILFPKKAAVFTMKVPEVYASLVSRDDEVLFFQLTNNGPYIPTLRTLHRYPSLLPKVTVDVGAIPFVLRSVNIVCQGTLAPGAHLPDGLKKGDFVGVYGDGREQACAIGKMLLSSEEIRAAGKGYAIENLHTLGDGLWMQSVPGSSNKVPQGGNQGKKKKRSDGE